MFAVFGGVCRACGMMGDDASARGSLKAEGSRSTRFDQGSGGFVYAVMLLAPIWREDKNGRERSEEDAETSAVGRSAGR